MLQTISLLDDSNDVDEVASSHHRVAPDNQLGMTPSPAPTQHVGPEWPTPTELEDDSVLATPPSWGEQPQAPAPPAQDPAHAPSHGALDRRVRRLLQPNAKGEYRVAEDIRKMWADGRKDQVFKLFAKCDNDPQTFLKRHSIKHEKEREREVGVFFKFMTEEEFKDKSETLS